MVAAREAGNDRSDRKAELGPFDVEPRRGSTLADALVTGLLVVYPAFATVAAIVVGLVLSGGGA